MGRIVEEEKEVKKEEYTLRTTQFVMFFEGKSSQKHLGNIYQFFEKRNSFASVTKWQSSNIGCFFVAQF